MRWMVLAAMFCFAAGIAGAQEMTPLRAERVAYADEMFKLDLTADPEGIVIRNGSFYDFESKSWEYCAMKRVFGIGKDYYQFWLSTGYATTGKVVGSISYDLTPLIATVFGLPVYDIISLDAGYYGGYDLVDERVAHGVGSTVIKVNAGELARTLGVSIF